jgi:hypothetical protein
VQYGWRDPSGERRPYRGWEMLTEAVWPGETSRVPVDVHTPADPGEWELDVHVERAGHTFGGATHQVAVHEAPPRSSRSAAAAELAGMRQQVARERSRARAAEDTTGALTRLRRYRVGAWVARRNGRDNGRSG